MKQFLILASLLLGCSSIAEGAEKEARSAGLGAGDRTNFYGVRLRLNLSDLPSLHLLYRLEVNGSEFDGGTLDTSARNQIANLDLYRVAPA